MSRGEGVYNVGTGSRITVSDLAHRVVTLTGSSSDIVLGEERPGEVRHSMADIDRIRTAGFVPAMSFNHALELTVSHFRERHGQMVAAG
jgi:UDP-glucose 4-epimerase